MGCVPDECRRQAHILKQEAFVKIASLSLILLISHVRKLMLFKVSSGIIVQFERNVVRIIACVVVRREGQYIREWIDYHLAMGFDELYVFDNNMGLDDLESIAEIAKLDHVTVIDKRDVNSSFNVVKQRAFYNDCYEFMGSSDWGLFIDADEFLTLRPGLTVSDFLNEANKIGCQSIKMNWMYFGSNGRKFRTNGTLIQRFPVPLPKGFQRGTTGVQENAQTKSFVKGGLFGKFIKSVHYFWGHVRA